MPIASVEDLKAARIDIGYRDFCAHLLIDLNKSRHQTLYMPWKCMDERHGYEKCQYIECVEGGQGSVRCMRHAVCSGAWFASCCFLTLWSALPSSLCSSWSAGTCDCK